MCKRSKLQIGTFVWAALFLLIGCVGASEKGGAGLEKRDMESVFQSQLATLLASTSTIARTTSFTALSESLASMVGTLFLYQVPDMRAAGDNAMVEQVYSAFVCDMSYIAESARVSGKTQKFSSAMLKRLKSITSAYPISSPVCEKERISIALCLGHAANVDPQAVVDVAQLRCKDPELTDEEKQPFFAALELFDSSYTPKQPEDGRSEISRYSNLINRMAEDEDIRIEWKREQKPIDTSKHKSSRRRHFVSSGEDSSSDQEEIEASAEGER